MNVYLNQFRIVKPAVSIDQQKTIEWTIKCHQAAERALETRTGLAPKISSERIAKLFERYAVSPLQISKRYSECEDVLRESFNKNQIYNFEQDPAGVSIFERTQFFFERSFAIFKEIYMKGADDARPDHLIHVSCTGYISPSAAQRIVVEKGWGRSTDVTHAYHMGCYAALPAVRLARALVGSEILVKPGFTTDIVHTEMCGLHMNALAHTPEQMVVQTLFADGHVKYAASGIMRPDQKNLRVLAVLEKVIPETENDMGWVPAASGMQMTLSRDVPSKLRAEIIHFTGELLEKAGVAAVLVPKAIFAVHPGGPRIIDAVQEVLSLAEGQIRESRKVLFERGNMSSATLPHVWDEILNQEYPSGTKVVSYAFGPGLTLFGSVFEIC